MALFQCFEFSTLKCTLHSWYNECLQFTAASLSGQKSHQWGGTQNASNTRQHVETSRLDIVLQRVNVEDGARICAPNFEIFTDRKKSTNKEECLKASTRVNQAKAWKEGMWNAKGHRANPLCYRPQRRTREYSLAFRSTCKDTPVIKFSSLTASPVTCWCTCHITQCRCPEGNSMQRSWHLLNSHSTPALPTQKEAKYLKSLVKDMGVTHGKLMRCFCLKHVNLLSL